ncbi:unnamed protein product [Linum trigynum]|uniref:Peroxidase n=1 Tax=Linum trigynum TaxID=586398 RepID=A0AAV2E9Y4_9ROSI
MMSRISLVLVLIFFHAALLVPHLVSAADLKVGFYKSTCPLAETIVRHVVEKRHSTDKSITAALLHLQFHDCFVRGCDASILIDSTAQNPSEKAAPPSATVRGYDLIDDIKYALEYVCPAQVSCADILALATRDSVALAGGPTYDLPTGRLDGLVSRADQVNLPAPTMSISQAFTGHFHPLGFTLPEMVTLLGAHTVGVAHCFIFQDRISNFSGSGRPDPAMDPALAASLRKTCSASGSPTAFLDQNTSFAVDRSYFRELTRRKGVLRFDQDLANDPSTSSVVYGFARDEASYRKSFAAAMVKMGNLKSGSGGGEVRKNCRVFNKPKSSDVDDGV